jgi:hypothetical protein
LACSDAAAHRDALDHPVSKALRFDSAEPTEMVGKTEGMALLGDGSLALINDDDFGITGGRAQIVVVKGTGIVRR